MQIKAIIKALSTESGVIFGNMVYETSNVTERNVVVLNDIYIDIMDYIFPNVCSGVASRTTCAEFDSENKVVAEKTSIQDEKLLDHALKCTKFMKYLIVPCVREGKCGFRTANSYAASVFPKDDTNVFLGLKKQPDGEVIGSIRMCRKTPEIATSFEEKFIILLQRSEPDAAEE